MHATLLLTKRRERTHGPQFLVFPGPYEASRNLDLQSDARNNHVEACRPHAMCIPIVGAACGLPSLAHN